MFLSGSFYLLAVATALAIAAALAVALLLLLLLALLLALAVALAVALTAGTSHLQCSGCCYWSCAHVSNLPRDFNSPWRGNLNRTDLPTFRTSFILG